jgi:hypothetical protein
MRRLSIVSSAALTAAAAVAAAHAQGQRSVSVPNSWSPGDRKIRINDHGGGSAGIQFKADGNLSPISILGGGGTSRVKLHDANDEKYGASQAKWPNTGRAQLGQQQHRFAASAGA